MTNLTLCNNRKQILDATRDVLVTGGPGSGKTTIALLKAANYTENGLEPDQKVLFLSFSRAAVARIVEAASREISDSTRRLLEIQTFHSFCWQFLQGYAYLLGAPRNLEIMLPHDERAHRNGVKNDDSSWFEERERLFSEEGRIVFDLFAPKAFSILTRSIEIRRIVSSRYPLVIVDEAQDTGDMQWACIDQLKTLVQLICLADREQQIYDFRSDVDPQRVNDILQALDPIKVDLGTQNNRSSTTEIVKFGNDILNETPRGDSYDGVYHFKFSPLKVNRNRAIRKSIGYLNRVIRDRTGNPPKNIALLTNWGKGVEVIARALQGNSKDESIPHRVVSDETEVFLATRVVAKLLEPVTDQWYTLATVLKLLSDLHRAKGGNSVNKAEKLLKYGNLAEEKRLQGSARAPQALKSLIDDLKKGLLTGNPSNDWITIRSRLHATEVQELKYVHDCVEYLMVFNRAHRIIDSLSDAWIRTGTYQNASSLIDGALVQDQLLGGQDQQDGLNIMTIHKSKGKEFDGVVIVHMGKISPLPSEREKLPYTKSRKLFRVGVTRARDAVLVLTDASSPCFLLRGHKLR